MANFELKNINIATIAILVDDSSGGVVPAVAGDVFTVVSSDPTKMTAVIGATVAGGPAIVLTPLVQLAPGLTVTVTDADGLTADAQIVDVVADLTPVAIALDIPNAVLTTQAMPAA